MKDGYYSVAYDKTELNGFVQDLYDKKMQEGKHGHYETMFHCVHQAIKKIYTRPQPAAWIGLTDEEMYLGDTRSAEEIEYARAIEAKLKEKNT